MPPVTSWRVYDGAGSHFLWFHSRLRSQETQTPISGRQRHIHMACAVSKNLSSCIVGALIFPSWKNHCTLAVMGETPETEWSDLFQWLSEKIHILCPALGGRSLIRWINSREGTKLPRWRAGCNCRQYTWNLIHWGFSCTMPAAVLTKQCSYLT